MLAGHKEKHDLMLTLMPRTATASSELLPGEMLVEEEEDDDDDSLTPDWC